MSQNDCYTNGGNFYVVLYNGVNAGSISNSGYRRYHRFLYCTPKKTEKINSSTSKMPQNSKTLIGSRASAEYFSNFRLTTNPRGGVKLAICSVVHIKTKKKKRKKIKKPCIIRPDVLTLLWKAGR